jgi:uncharacterized OB-fold protein/acyl dehydratase
MTWNKPLPHPTPISISFWEGLKAHEVRLQQCEEHGHWLFFPRTHCPTCGSRKLAWRTVSGAGTLYTFTVGRVPTLPEFTDEMPQLLAVVELDEGVHINTTMVGVDPADLKVGQRVRPVFDDRPGEVTLLRYAPVDSAHASVMAADEAAPVAVVEQTDVAPKRKISCKDLDAMKSLISANYSDWSNQIEVTQELINQFAALSGDDYWIHTDPEKAKRDSPFGTTIAHGSLVQVLTSRLKMPMDFEIVDFGNIVNYGSDRLRFPSIVPAGCRIHARYRIKAVEQLKSGVQMTMEINIHVVGQDRPSVINDLVMLYM